MGRGEQTVQTEGTAWAKTWSMGKLWPIQLPGLSVRMRGKEIQNLFTAFLRTPGNAYLEAQESLLENLWLPGPERTVPPPSGSPPAQAPSPSQT